MDIALNLRQIEERIGRLSPVQKILLSTDGSVTQLLEAVTGNPVEIRTRLQEIVPADSLMAGHLADPARRAGQQPDRGVNRYKDR